MPMGLRVFMLFGLFIKDAYATDNRFSVPYKTISHDSISIEALLFGVQQSQRIQPCSKMAAYQKKQNNSFHT